MTIDREENIIKSLEDISYTGTLLDKNVLAKALEEGPKNSDYTEAVSFLTNELRSLCNIDEQINKISSPEDSISFLMELSSFLKELGCPYDNLTQGHISDRLVEIDDRQLLLEYLITELMAARMVQESKPDKKIELKLQETPHAANMKRILSTLRFPKPPANLSVQSLFSKLTPTVEANVKKGGNDLIGTPIFNLSLTDKQWHILQQVQQDLHSEYTIRREMLIKRLDCTIQSFQWSDRMKGKEELLTKTYSDKRKQLKVEPVVNISDLISARDDLAIIEKTSSAHVLRNTRSAVNRVIIGQVPDRGGRTDEMAPPPPEMPSWQQRSSGPMGGGGPRGRGGGQFMNTGRGRGDFSRGGRQSNDFNRGGGGNDFNRGRGSDYSRGHDYNRSGSASYSRGGGGGSNYGRGGGASDYSRGGSTYSSGGSDYNRGGSDYSRGGSTYSSGGSDYNRGGNSFNRGGNDFNRGGNDFNRASGNDSNKGGSAYGSASGNFDSAGSFGGNSYRRNSSTDRSGSDRRSGNFDSAGSYGSGSFSSDYNRSTTADYNKTGGTYQSYGGNRASSAAFDSAGSFGGYKDYQANEAKRAKTYDYFQSNKTTYADQYVQESQHNQQYHSKDNRGRGSERSQYNRGGRY